MSTTYNKVNLKHMYETQQTRTSHGSGSRPSDFLFFT